MTKQEEIREGQAELEHEQWVKWSQSIAEVETLSPDRLTRWEKLWIPYANLTEEQKDQDREWADKSIALLHSQGVVIKVDREIGGEVELDGGTFDAIDPDYLQYLNTRFKAVEPLIEE